MNNPSRLLVDTALRYWYDLGMRADNISVVTVMLDPAGPCKREVLLKQRVMKRLRPRDEQSITEGKHAFLFYISFLKITNFFSSPCHEAFN